MLTDVACRKALPGEKDRKLADGRGLYLLVKPSGAKSWRLKYRVAGKEKKLAIGPYPAVSITKARAARDVALQQLQDGLDPGVEKQVRKAKAAAEALDSFEKCARAWHAIQAKSLSEKYATAVLSRLENNVFPSLGPIPLRSITAPMVLAVIRQIEQRGAHDMAHRVRNHVSSVFVYAIASGLADLDPAAMIKNALHPTNSKLRPALVQVASLQTLLTDIEGLTGTYWSTLLASRLLALTAARPGVVRLAEMQEFEDLDGPKPVWRIPARKMKLTRVQKRDITWEFVIPLSRQAAAVARAAISESPACHSEQGHSWLFPGVKGWKRPISDSTLSKLYREAGFTGMHVPHGWRSSFSTIMNERAALEDQVRDRAIIDLMLAHSQKGVEPIYNRALYLPRRRELGQIWADMLMKDVMEPHLLLPEHRHWRAKSGEPGHERRRQKSGAMAQKL